MRIIIVGDGKVGYTLASHLSRENNDIVIIDRSIDALRKASDMLDVMCIRGNGLSASTLLEAGIADTDIIIAATSRDEVNMLCCLTAKKLGARHTIARIRDPEYTAELSMLKKELELDLVINPEQEAANEITRLIRFPTATNIDTFAGGKVELVGFRILADSPLIKAKLSKVSSRFNAPLLICAVERGEDVYIPNGDFVLQPDDIAYVIGEPAGVNVFFKNQGQYTDKIKSTMVIGGSRIAHYLINDLIKTGIRVKLIEIDEQKCMDLNESLGKCLIINGDGTDEELLLYENINEMDAVITLTGRDEENLITALYASQLGVPKVIAKINKIDYNGIVKKLGVESIISPKNITAFQIIRYVRALEDSLTSSFETMYQLVGGKVEALEFIANDSTDFLNIPLKKIKLKKDIIIGALMRRNNIIIPNGNTEIHEGDSVIIVTKTTEVSSLNAILATSVEAW